MKLSMRNKLLTLFYGVGALYISSANSAEINAPLYESCMVHIEQYSKKAEEVYGAHLTVTLFDQLSNSNNAIKGSVKIVATDADFIFNGLKRLCYPESFFEADATINGIKEIKYYSNKYGDYHIDMKGDRVRIYYNDTPPFIKDGIKKY